MILSRKHIRTALCFAIIGIGMIVFQSSDAHAQVEVRLNVKFILDETGARPVSGSLNTDSDVEQQVADANLLYGKRGITIKLVSITDISGVSEWYTVTPRSGDNVQALEATATLEPELYNWSDYAINLYINGEGTSGACSFPEAGQTIFLGQSLANITLAHEIGHFLGLFHTQGRICGSCTDGSPGPECVTVPGDDEIDDTIGDLSCWGQDDIAFNKYGMSYASLTDSRKDRVDDVWLNIMSYHSNRDRFTADQYDRMGVIINGSRSNVSSGKTIFVESITDSGTDEAAGWISSSFFLAIGDASDGDAVVLRGIDQDWSGTIGADGKGMTLCSSRGATTITGLVISPVAPTNTNSGITSK